MAASGSRSTYLSLKMEQTNPAESFDASLVYSNVNDVCRIYFARETC